MIATRDRPSLVLLAIASVLAQDEQDMEVLVVDDGSEPALSMEWLANNGISDPRLRVHHLSRQPRGRGPAYTRNVGAWLSRGEWIAFLDDDDTWTANDHLSATRQMLVSCSEPVEVCLADQVALDSDGKSRRLWLYPLVEKLQASGERFHRVGVTTLMNCSGFPHLNTVIVARALFERVNGLDEYLSYEEDLDLYLRLIDRARGVSLQARTVARHNVPAPEARSNVTTQQGDLRKLQMRLNLLQKNMLHCQHAQIAKFCARRASDTCKHQAQILLASGHRRRASRLAWEGLALRFSFKYAAFCCCLSVGNLGRAWS